MKDLTKFYDRLDADERTALYIDAIARDDKVERDKLIETCPRQNYSMRDIAFSRNIDCILQMVFLLNIQIRDIALREAVAMGAMVSKGHLEEWEEHDQAQKVMHHCRARIKALLMAWDQFCTSIGIETDKSLKAFALELPVWIREGMVPELTAHIEADPETIEVSLRAMMDCWDTRE